MLHSATAEQVVLPFPANVAGKDDPALYPFVVAARRGPPRAACLYPVQCPAASNGTLPWPPFNLPRRGSQAAQETKRATRVRRLLSLRHAVGNLRIFPDRSVVRIPARSALRRLPVVVPEAWQRPSDPPDAASESVQGTKAAALRSPPGRRSACRPPSPFAYPVQGRAGRRAGHGRSPAAREPAAQPHGVREQAQARGLPVHNLPVRDARGPERRPQSRGQDGERSAGMALA